jgi:hypothetical protein
MLETPPADTHRQEYSLASGRQARWRRYGYINHRGLADYDGSTDIRHCCHYEVKVAISPIRSRSTFTTPICVDPSSPQGGDNTTNSQHKSGHEPIQGSMPWPHGSTDRVGRIATSASVSDIDFTLRMEATRSSESLVSCHITTRCHNQKTTTRITIQAPITSPWRWSQHGPPKRWYTTTSIHGVITGRPRLESLSKPQSLHLEDGGSMVLRNVGILPHHYTEEDLDSNVIKMQQFSYCQNWTLSPCKYIPDKMLPETLYCYLLQGALKTEILPWNLILLCSILLKRLLDLFFTLQIVHHSAYISFCIV